MDNTIIYLCFILLGVFKESGRIAKKTEKGDNRMDDKFARSMPAVLELYFLTGYPGKGFRWLDHVYPSEFADIRMCCHPDAAGSDSSKHPGSLSNTYIAGFSDPDGVTQPDCCLYPNPCHLPGGRQ